MNPGAGIYVPKAGDKVEFDTDSLQAAYPKDKGYYGLVLFKDENYPFEFVVDIYKNSEKEGNSILCNGHKMSPYQHKPQKATIYEILEAIEPFDALATEILENTNYDKHQNVYGYNGKQISMDDLRRIKSLCDKLKGE